MGHVNVPIRGRLNLDNEMRIINPWHYSSEEPRPTEMVAAKWHTGRKALSLNLNFSFPNRISLLLTSSSYPIVLRRLGGPRSRPFTSRKMSRVKPGIEPGTSWMAVRRANYYINQAPRPRIEIKILHTTGN